MKQFFQLIIVAWTIVYLLSGDYQKQTHVNGVYRYGEWNK